MYNAHVIAWSYQQRMNAYVDAKYNGAHEWHIRAYFVDRWYKEH